MSSITEDLKRTFDLASFRQRAKSLTRPADLEKMSEITKRYAREGNKQEKLYKRDYKRGAGKFIQFDHWVYDSAAWQALKPGPRALYLEMKRRYNGFNNGEIFLSQRDASNALNIGRDTVEKYAPNWWRKDSLSKPKATTSGVRAKGKRRIGR